VTEAVTLLKAIGHPLRFRIADLLTRQPALSVSEVCTLLDTKQPIISQQLSILRKSRVVVGRRDGNRVIYAMASARVAEIVRLLRNDASSTWEEPRTNGEYRQ
jgi:ArsR family transcriptional regulator